MNSIANLTSSSLTVGNHTISASYGGDSLFLPSGSSSLNQVIGSSMAVATFTTSSLANGSHQIKAVYGGDSSNQGSESSVLTQSIGSSSSATVSLSTSSLWTGSHQITAFYNGDSSHSSSVSPVVVQTMTANQFCDDEDKEGECQSMFAFFDIKNATRKAVSNGNWTSPSTWAGGVVPGNGDRIYIPSGVTVTYDCPENAPTTTLDWINVFGTLTFSTTVSTKLVVETLFVSTVGTLIIGSASAPIPDGITVDIQFVCNTPIDKSRDLVFFTRGLISAGRVRTKGVVKPPFVPLAGNALAGSTTITLASSVPATWKVGDNLVLPGTKLVGQDDLQDEVLTISAISGNNITISQALQNDHTVFSGYGLSLYVANLTRNITLRSLYTLPGTLPIPQRAHVMFMHNPDVDFENVLCLELGRTNKKLNVDDPVGDGTNADGTPAGGTNPRANYACHFHRTGATDKNSTPVGIVDNCAVWNSPGWGFVNHDSHAIIRNCVAFGCVGAAYVAEFGTEFGSFDGNIAIGGHGQGPQEFGRVGGDFFLGKREQNFDFGFTGDGFWFQGPVCLTSVQNNVAASMLGFGFMLMNSGEEIPEDRKFQILDSNLPDPSYASGHIQFHVGGAAFYGDFPIRTLANNTAYNVNQGLSNWKNQRFNLDGNIPPSNRAMSTLVTGMKIWGVHSEGVFTLYSQNAEYRDCLVLGNPGSPIQDDGTVQNGVANQPGFGFSGNNPNAGHSYHNVRTEGFNVGMEPPFSEVAFMLQFDCSSLVDGCQFANNVNHFGGFVDDEFGTPFSYPANFAITPTSTFTPQSGAPLPTAAFTFSVGSNRTVTFDGSGSSSTMVTATLVAPPKIVSWMWDFGDGNQQAGTTVSHTYATSGNRTVVLKVYDSMGQTATVSHGVTV